MKHYIKKGSKSNLIQTTAVFYLVVFITSIAFNQLNINRHENKTTLIESSSIYYLNKIDIVDESLHEKEDIINFFAYTFQINSDILKEKLRNDYEEINWDNFDASLVSYLFKLEKKEKELFSKKFTPCTEDKTYMVALIKYYTNIYSSVDFTIAASIAQIESNYKSLGMLKKNNIFGGMSGGKLLSYKNIEYGILRYIKLLNDGYFNKGLTTIEAIGKKYNPRIIDGKKIASPVWVANVTKATDSFKNQEEVDINILKSLKNNS